MSNRIDVSVHEYRTQIEDPLEAMLRLRRHFGDDRVFLLESLSGPAADRRASLMGMTGLLEVSVYRGVLSYAGLEVLICAVREALLRQNVVRRGADGTDILINDAALWDLARVMDQMFEVPRSCEKFGFGVMAFYGYDAVRYIEQLPREIEDCEDPVPDAVFSLVHALVSCHPEGGEAEIVIASSQCWGEMTGEEIIEALSLPSGELAEELPVPEPSRIRDEMSEDEFLVLAERCLEHIRLGDIYQVQLGHEITVESQIEPVQVYRRLRRRNPSPYMSLIPIAGRMVLSASPELFVRLEGKDSPASNSQEGTGSQESTGPVATMRPIAGTTRRSLTGDESTDRRVNDEATAALLADPKERAEHIMLVDLCRNDMGRVSVPMTVQVPDLMMIETYSHMFHIVSTVVSEVKEGADVYDVIKACFPAGTMTGAPKVRAMEIIESIEHSRRGFYAGAYGLIGFGGWSILGLAIRMTVHHEGTYSLRASAGIVADSVTRSEWRETLTKLGATYWAVTGKEIL